MAQKSLGDNHPSPLQVWVSRHRVVSALIALALAAPMLLSPIHPVGVYGYLAWRYSSPVFAGTVPSETQFSAFLLSPEQTARYRSDLVDDLLDNRGGKLFAIVRCADGRLEQAEIRTWNSFLPVWLPEKTHALLDLKEIPFLSDSVGLWLDGKDIVAMGHYHPYGGPPSKGDLWAQRFSPVPEIVVANGLVPALYIGGEFLPYGSNIEISAALHRSTRTLEYNLYLRSGLPGSMTEQPSASMQSFFVYLRDYCNTDLEDLDAVADAVGKLHDALQQSCRPVFRRGVIPTVYEDDPDKKNMLLCMLNVRLWVSTMKALCAGGRPEVMERLTSSI